MTNIQIFSTDTDDGVVSVVSKTGTGEHRLIEQIRVGNAPRGGVKFLKNGRGFVCNTSQNTLSEIDAVALREARRIEVGFGPRGLAIYPGDHHALVSNSGSDTLSIVDLDLNVQVAEIPMGRDPRHMAISPDGRFAYVCVWGDGFVSKLDVSGLAHGDIASVREVGRIDIDQTAHPYSLNFDSAGKQVFVANTQATYGTVIDVETDTSEKIEFGEIGGRAVAFTPDGKLALFTLEAVNRVYVVDVTSHEVLRYIPVGPGPRGLTVDAKDDTIYVTNFKRGTTFATAGPDFAANSLTAVDLKSAPLTRQEGEFTYEEVMVGYGPCSVVTFDLDTLSPEDRSRRLEDIHA
ncbi:hypothetical protein H489_0106895 [Curtobacterium flaccumfaciens UCD-AKU]|uniref:beta-propeller fold lactonase family protein n=1 Tax=Curtobacterium flaccumfaciens TaxID=2035 RepID=UPI000437BD1D|nr:beta-propeller fold lactonase family protein [Curtobacterium flaccumfaciens]EYT65532.1 hypothetical protein H489_0106895 [Curtobacterium flaccumfaciens UCD-AKU]